MLVRAIFAFLALPGVVAFALPLWIARSGSRPLRLHSIWLIAVIAGAALLLWSAREFYVAGRGTLAPWSPPRHLVTTGPYRRSRNPMYIGVLVILIGWAAYFGSTGLLAYAGVVTVAFYLRVRLVEESWAARQFGSEWAEYRMQVPRWLL